MCITRRTQFRCGHAGPAIAVGACRSGFDFHAARCSVGRDEPWHVRDLLLHPEECAGCRAARLGIVRPRGWRPQPLQTTRSDSHHHSRHHSHSHSHSSDKDSTSTSNSGSRRSGGKTAQFVRYVVGDDADADADDYATNYNLSRARRAPKTTGWRYAEQAHLERQARASAARQQRMTRDRIRGEEQLLRTLIPGAAMPRSSRGEDDYGRRRR